MIDEHAINTAFENITSRIQLRNFSNETANWERKNMIDELAKEAYRSFYAGTDLGWTWEESPEKTKEHYRKLIRDIERRRMSFEEEWSPIETAPKDGTEVIVYADTRYGLPSFQTTCTYHPDAGWCVDELRLVTHWKPKELS